MNAISQARALFGVGFIVLGGLALYRVVTVPAPAGNRLLGTALAVAMIAFGVLRIVQYARRSASLQGRR